MIGVEEFLYLAHKETLALGEGYHDEYESTQEDAHEEVVVGDGVGHRRACHSQSASPQLGMKKGILREEGFLIILWQTELLVALPRRPARQMERIGTLAPCDFAWLDVGPDGRVHLGGRSRARQPAQHLGGGELVMGRGLLCGSRVHRVGQRISLLLHHFRSNALRMLSTLSSFSHVKSSTSMVRVS